MARRCRWCGRFVPASKPRTWRQVYGFDPAGQLAWRAYVQTLCTDCRPAWTRDSPWNQPVQPRMPVNDLG